MDNPEIQSESTPNELHQGETKASEQPAPDAAEPVKTAEEVKAEAKHSALMAASKQCAVVANDAAKSMRQKMGLKEDYEGGLFGKKLSSEINEILIAKARAHIDRTL